MSDRAEQGSRAESLDPLSAHSVTASEIAGSASHNTAGKKKRSLKPAKSVGSRGAPKDICSPKSEQDPELGSLPVTAKADSNSEDPTINSLQDINDLPKSTENSDDTSPATSYALSYYANNTAQSNPGYGYGYTHALIARHGFPSTIQDRDLVANTFVAEAEEVAKSSLAAFDLRFD